MSGLRLVETQTTLSAACPGPDRFDFKDHLDHLDLVII